MTGNYKLTRTYSLTKHYTVFCVTRYAQTITQNRSVFGAAEANAGAKRQGQIKLNAIVTIKILPMVLHLAYFQYSGGA